MTTSRATCYLAILILVSALLRWPVYTYPFQIIGVSNYWNIATIGSNLFMVSFLIIPVLGMIGVLRNWKTKYLWLALAPIIFFFLGSIPIPFSSYLYSESHELNTKIILAINLVIIGFIIWLYLNEKKTH